MNDVVPNEATGYVAAAYVFFLLMVLVYIAILGAKFQRISRDLGRLVDEVEARSDKRPAPAAEDGTEVREKAKDGVDV